MKKMFAYSIFFATLFIGSQVALAIGAAGDVGMKAMSASTAIVTSLLIAFGITTWRSQNGIMRGLILGLLCGTGLGLAIPTLLDPILHATYTNHVKAFGVAHVAIVLTLLFTITTFVNYVKRAELRDEFLARLNASKGAENPKV